MTCDFCRIHGSIDVPETASEFSCPGASVYPALSDVVEFKPVSKMTTVTDSTMPPPGGINI